MNLKRTIATATLIIMASTSFISVSANDTAPVEAGETIIVNEAFTDGFDMVFRNETIHTDVSPQVFSGKVMVPLRAVAEALGFDVTWNEATKGIDLVKGPNATTVYVGENSYFRFRMASRPLSSEPVIIEDRTLVPVEFVTEILGYGVDFLEGHMTIHEEPFITLTGYVSMIETNDNHSKVYVAPREGDDVDMLEQTVLIVSGQTVINRDMYAVGDYIQGVHMPMMTMSIPGQTSAVIIY